MTIERYIGLILYNTRLYSGGGQIKVSVKKNLMNHRNRLGKHLKHLVLPIAIELGLAR